MRAIRTIIHVWLLSQLFQLGSWRELSQIDDNLMRNWKFAVFEIDFLLNQIVFEKSAVIKPYETVPKWKYFSGKKNQ